MREFRAVPDRYIICFAEGMTPDDLKARTKKFAVDVIRFTKQIPKDHINDEIALERGRRTH